MEVRQHSCPQLGPEAQLVDDRAAAELDAGLVSMNGTLWFLGSSIQRDAAFVAGLHVQRLLNESLLWKRPEPHNWAT